MNKMAPLFEKLNDKSWLKRIPHTYGWDNTFIWCFPKLNNKKGPYADFKTGVKNKSYLDLSGNLMNKTT